MDSAIHLQILIVAFALGVVFGVVASKTNFCTLGAVSDWVNMGHTGRMRAWVFSMAVALVGVTLMENLAGLDLASTFPPYRTAQFAWLRYIVGGLMFGIGMTLASGCGSKTLIRIGGGNLKSVVALLAAALFAWLLIWTPAFERYFAPWIQFTTIDLARHGISGQDAGTLFAVMFGLEPSRAIRLGVGAVVAAGLIAYVFSSADFRNSRDNVIGGLVIGLVVAAGWYLTGAAPGQAWQENAAMAIEVPSRVQTQSFTFISPMADAVHYLRQPGQLQLINFGMAGFAGVVLGSLAYALATGGFRYERFRSINDVGGHAIGGALMGAGGVLAMGCTIGQGVTGVSTLAIGSMLTFFSMVIGSAGTMKFQYWRMMQEA